MTPRTFTYLRRFAFATLLAAAATLSGSAFGDSATACAEPREWDIERYDSCVAFFLADYQSGDTTFQEYNQSVKNCCYITGGDWSGGQCVAAPFAEEAERQPAPPALPEVEATLWMPPPPAGPVAPPPSEAVLAP